MSSTHAPLRALLRSARRTVSLGSSNEACDSFSIATFAVGFHDPSVTSLYNALPAGKLDGARGACDGKPATCRQAVTQPPSQPQPTEAYNFRYQTSAYNKFLGFAKSPLLRQPGWFRPHASTTASAAWPTTVACYSTTSNDGAGPSDGRRPEEAAPQLQQQSATGARPTGPPGAGSAAAPVQNPLQAAIAAAAAAAAPRAGAAAARAGGGTAAGGRRPRTWLWYDEEDERMERRKERQRERYDDAGTAYLLDIPQSLKKMNRIMKLVRGLSYPEALAQCKLVPHKAAGYVVHALEKAYEDATENKGLNGERLVVGTIFVTKGVTEKGIRPMGRGNSGRHFKRKSHLRVVLREVAPGGGTAAGILSLRGPLAGAAALAAAATAGQPGGGKVLLGAFTARQVEPLMGRWGRGAMAGPEAGGRKRFAYRLEV